MGILLTILISTIELAAIIVVIGAIYHIFNRRPKGVFMVIGVIGLFILINLSLIYGGVITGVNIIMWIRMTKLKISEENETKTKKRHTGLGSGRR